MTTQGTKKKYDPATALIAMILGIVAVVFSLAGPLVGLAFWPAILAIIIGLVARNKADKAEMKCARGAWAFILGAAAIIIMLVRVYT
jgi:hypothetical protein